MVVVMMSPDMSSFIHNQNMVTIYWLTVIAAPFPKASDSKNNKHAYYNDKYYDDKYRNHSKWKRQSIFPSR